LIQKQLLSAQISLYLSFASLSLSLTNESQTNQGLGLGFMGLNSHPTSCHTLGIFGTLSMMSRGAPTWFETVWRYGVEAIHYGIIFSMKTK